MACGEAEDEQLELGISHQVRCKPRRLWRLAIVTHPLTISYNELYVVFCYGRLRGYGETP